MRQQHPIQSAPKDGRTVTVLWTDFDGQLNESPARYHNLDQLKNSGGDWNERDSGWWVFTDSTTLKKIDPTAWIENPEDEADADE